MAPSEIDKNNIQYDIVSRFGFGAGETTEIGINVLSFFNVSSSSIQHWLYVTFKDFQYLLLYI